MGETRRKFDQDIREGAVRLVRETGKPDIGQVTCAGRVRLAGCGLGDGVAGLAAAAAQGDFARGLALRRSGGFWIRANWVRC